MGFGDEGLVSRAFLRSPGSRVASSQLSGPPLLRDFRTGRFASWDAHKCDRRQKEAGGGQGSGLHD